ncbi:MAG: hypothetical protein ACI3XO_04615 [Eubacteriales bacterium]
MKRSYQKPELEVEMFQLDADMAAGCKYIIYFADSTCIDDPMGRFTEKLGCTAKDDICYQGYGADNYFNS